MTASTESASRLARIAPLHRRDRSDLVLSTIPFVASIAREYRNMGLPHEDLMSEGKLGLIHAAARFDDRRGVKFITYAGWWVRKQVLKALVEQGPMIRVPAYQRQKLRERGDRSRGEGGRVRGSGVSQRAISASEPAPPPHPRWVPLDAEPTSDGHARMLDLLSDPCSEDPEAELIRREQIDRLKRSLSCLSARERFVIDRRFGLGGGPVETLENVGRAMSLSKERVRQIESTAKMKLAARLRSVSFRSLAVGR